jgi:hypothetical protein
LPPVFRNLFRVFQIVAVEVVEKCGILRVQQGGIRLGGILWVLDTDNCGVWNGASSSVVVLPDRERSASRGIRVVT